MALQEYGFLLPLVVIFLFTSSPALADKRRPGSGPVEEVNVQKVGPSLADKITAPSENTRIDQDLNLSDTNQYVTYELTELTQIIYVDKSNEVGYLTATLSNKSRETSCPKDFASIPVDSSRETGREKIGQSHAATNFSVYLLSHSKEHIAVLLDFEQVDFEPVINCENQEIRISIVGEISKQLLNKKNNSDHGTSPRGSSSEELPEESAGSGEGSSQGNIPSASHDTNGPPPLPVSEAMAMLLNSPLNETLLDDSVETNDFKIIDSTIDYLFDETCHELVNGTSNHLNHPTKDDDAQRDRNRRETNDRQDARRGERKPKRRGRRVSKRMRNKKKQKNQMSSTCSHESSRFKSLMINKLGEHFEWDDFKIVCGKIRQLVIPMRSLKLSFYSDEFSPDSKFTIKYQFVNDPSLLPAFDNGYYYCRNRNAIDIDLKCNGVDDCGDASDESIKFCGYPTGKAAPSNDASNHSSLNQYSTISAKAGGTDTNQSPSNGSHFTQHHSNKKRLTYVSGDVLHCCQSSDWQSIIPQNQANHMINLQSLIGESMNLFSGPIYAPARRQLLHRVKRIVGGGVASKGTWPGQVSLQYELLEPLCHFCAGTLIHPQYVLTAGHCITKDGLNRGIKVVLGAHDLRQLNGSHIQERYVDDALIYPGVDVKHLSYDWENDMNNDIALLRLNAPVLITPHVAPACLPPFNTPLAINTTCRSIGWGQTHGSGNSNLLKHLSLKIVNSTLCSKELFDKDNDEDEEGADRYPTGPYRSKGRNRLTSEFETTSLDQFSNSTMVCVNNDLGHGICQGDSGGPLYCDRTTSTGEICTEIYGVASFIIQYATVGAMCAVENLPGIFGEVSSKSEWISSSMKMFEQTYRIKYS